MIGYQILIYSLLILSTLNNSIKVILRNEELAIPELEMQIAFKEVVLRSEKDIEDARHLRNVAKDYLNEGLEHKGKTFIY